MAFTPTASLKGSNQVFSVSPTCKGYTLRDNGFTETKSGNFQLIRSLDNTIDDHRGLKLKVMVDKDKKSLKISTVTKNGLQTVDLYGKSNTAMAVEKLEFILEGLVERGVLEVTMK
jgi:hypothetical protein